MTQVHAGRTKESLDLVDSSLVIAEVVGVFGNFVKYTTDRASEQVEVCLAKCFKGSLSKTHTCRKEMHLKS